MNYASMYSGVSQEAINLLENFWPRVTGEIQQLTSADFKNPELPLARIKKIMKLDDEVKMISAEAPVIFAKAAELFIQEVTIRAWLHTEENKRRTLQRNDVALAISKYDQFDFLIDIVPREEIKPPSKKENNSPTGATNVGMTIGGAASAIGTIDGTNLLSVLNGSGQAANVIAGANPNGNNFQYYLALPTNGMQNGAGLPLQIQNLSGIQTIQGLSNGMQGIQTIQGIQGLQNLQGTQIIMPNGQPFVLANRDC